MTNKQTPTQPYYRLAWEPSFALIFSISVNIFS